MKNKIITVLALMGLITFGSCKKNYTCTCITVVSTLSTTETHSINSATHNDAQNTCNDYQAQANATLPGQTTCHL